MKLKIGDKVKFLNDSGEGIVSKILDEKFVKVQIEDGFDIPVLIEELIRTGDNYDDDSDVDFETQQRLEKKGHEKADQNDNMIYLAIMPDEDDVECNLYLVNATPYHIMFNILSLTNNSYENLYAAGAESGDITFIDTFRYEQLTSISKFNFQLLFYKDDDDSLMDPFRMELSVNWVRLKLGIYYSNCSYFDEKAALFEVVDLKKRKESIIASYGLKGELSDKMGEDLKEESVKSIKKDQKNQIEEVDLHIEQLIDDHRGLSNREILDVQMGRFATALEGGILHNTRRMVFIHGMGNGKLKHEIRKELDVKYKNLKYQDASFKEYGYGATLVILR